VNLVLSSSKRFDASKKCIANALKEEASAGGWKYKRGWLLLRSSISPLGLKKLPHKYLHRTGKDLYRLLFIYFLFSCILLFIWPPVHGIPTPIIEGKNQIMLELRLIFYSILMRQMQADKQTTASSTHMA